MFRPYAAHTAAPPAELPTMVTRQPRNGLWIGVGVGVLIVGGIIVAVVASSDGSGHMEEAVGSGSASAVTPDPPPPPAGPRAQASGYSVPVPVGWKEIHEEGQRPNEIILEQQTPEVGATGPAGMYLELLPYNPKADATGTAENCKSMAEYIARNAGAVLDEHRIVQTEIGPGCLNRVHDDREHRLGMQVTIGGGQLTLGATCTYDVAASTHPGACMEIIDGLTLD
jgi:hypothetical protein